MTTYYIDPDYGAGGDGSFETPFDSWADVTWAAGSVYLQKESSVFYGPGTTTPCFRPAASGSSEETRVVCGTYDATTGDQILDGTRRAIIDGAGGQYGIVPNGTYNYITVHGLELRNFRHATAAKAIYTGVGNGTNFVVKYCKIHDVRNNTEVTGSFGIQSFSDGAKFLYNEVYNMGCDGIYAEGDNVEIAHNTIYDVSNFGVNGDNIQLADTVLSTSTFWVHHNYLDHREVDCKQCFIVTSGGAGAPSSGGIFEHNTCIGYEGAALHKPVYIGSASAIARFNVVSGGIRCIDLDSMATGAVAHTNVLTNSGAVANTNGVVVTANDQQVYGNTIINTAGAGANTTYGVHQSSSYTGVTIQNNVVQGWKYGVRVHATNPATEDHNNYYENTVNKVNNSLTPQALGTGSITTDPLLSAAYRPLPDSPLIGAGTYIAD